MAEALFLVVSLIKVFNSNSFLLRPRVLGQLFLWRLTAVTVFKCKQSFYRLRTATRISWCFRLCFVINLVRMSERLYVAVKHLTVFIIELTLL